MNAGFQLVSDYSPAGDQPAAIAQLTKGLVDLKQDQVLLGVTGSGKTYTMAQVINNLQRPALVMAHNKTLAAQLYSEMKHFFPHNAVEYFVSHFDYYQPEAYVPRTDTFIEKDSSINEQIDRMRHSATRALLERRDVIVVASVSCIYGIGAAETYYQFRRELRKGEKVDQRKLMKELIELQYKRNDLDFRRGTFRVRGDVLDIFPSHMASNAWRLSFFGDEIESITEFDTLTGETFGSLPAVVVFANSHYVTPRPKLEKAIHTIKDELKDTLSYFQQTGKLLEAQRLEQRTQFDLEMMVETGVCKGIENYSRHLNGSAPGVPPPTLFQYLPEDALLFVDESHVAVPQVGGMYRGDHARKSVLAEHGFRLPSCLDNRPLKFEEWDSRRPQTIYVSATPGPFEIERAHGEIVEQIIRPTGLTDPPYEIRPVNSQVDDLMEEIRLTIDHRKGYRILVTTLTKRMAEELTDYLQEAGRKVAYLHSDVDTLDRIDIIRDLRLGTYDVLVGVNLLREGLDIPECGLVAILDADKEGFLRSQTSLIQTIGRAARNVDAKVILYADRITDSMKYALAETDRRRGIQEAYNAAHGITPMTVKSRIADALNDTSQKDYYTVDVKKKTDKEEFVGSNLEAHLKYLRGKMLEAAADLEFEEAARLRDELEKLQADPEGLVVAGKGRSRKKA